MFEFHFLVVSQDSLFLPISIRNRLLSAVHKKTVSQLFSELSVCNLVIHRSVLFSILQTVRCFLSMQEAIVTQNEN
jgi:hypothetical protein